MAPLEQAPPSLDPDQKPRSHPSAQWNATPGLPCPRRSCPEPCMQITQGPLTSPTPQSPTLTFPMVSHWDVDTRGPAGDLRENDNPLPKGSVQGRGCPHQVSGDPQLRKGRIVPQGQPSLLTPAGGRGSAQVSTLTAVSSNHMCTMLLLNSLPWLPPPTRENPLT